VTATWAAPGRVNLIGEHVDYNDGLVLPFALPWTTTTRATRRTGGVAVSSRSVGRTGFDVDVAPGEVTGWAGYVAGVVWALRQRGLDVPGLELVISTDVPLGAGLSSSAALTCSVACAISDECGFGLTRREVAAVARAAENDYIGVPTGVMDQFAALLCRPGSVLLLDCRSLQTRHIELGLARAGLRLLLIDSGVRHRLVASEYTNRRRDCEAAVTDLGIASLRDASADQVATLPSERLRRRARHVTTEIQRVAAVVACLEAGRVATIGGLLTDSHESLRDDFEVSCPECDVIVDTAVSAGAIGARMVGGGFGGCVLAVCRTSDEAGVRHAVEVAYAARGWATPRITSPQPSQAAHKLS
jgi:galactokinase